MKMRICLLAVVILLAGCAAPAPTDIGAEASTPEQILEETESEQIFTEPNQGGAANNFNGEDIGDAAGSGTDSDIAALMPETGESLDEIEQWISQSPYAKAYYSFLQECILNGGTPISASGDIPVGIWAMRFELVFIDGDDIPELLIFLDDSHAAGVEVFTYNGDSVIAVGEFGSSGRMQYVEKGGMIFSHHMGQGEAHTYFFRMEDGEAEQVSHMHSWPDHSGYLETGEYREFYEIDELSVTEDVYQAKWQELYDSQEYVLIGYEDGILLKEETELLPALAQAIEKLLWKRDSGPVMKQVAKQSGVLAAYAKTLEEYSEEVSFSLIYLDDDDIPELVIFKGMSHMDGGELYVYDQGESVYVGTYGQYGATTYLEREGIIFHDYDHGGDVFLGVHQIDKTADILLHHLNCIQQAPEDGREEVAYTYRVDDREVSKEEYDEAWKNWNDGYRVLEYSQCTPVEDTNIQAALEQELQTLILTQYDVMRQNIRIKSGMGEDGILMMNYDDYDRDGKYEAFVFCGESYEEYGKQLYEGALWFVSAQQCTLLREERYRMIDGQMKLGPGQKYLYLYSDLIFTANISDLWTVENGEPLESRFSRIGMVIQREGERDLFEIYIDRYDHCYDPIDEIWLGHTYKPYFYYYDWNTGQIEEDESELLSPGELELLCGFDLAAEVEAKGYEITDIIKWDHSNIVAVNYTIPADEEDPYPDITYENIIWDCNAGDYWRSAERRVTSWQNAGEGGSFCR